MCTVGCGHVDVFVASRVLVFNHSGNFVVVVVIIIHHPLTSIPPPITIYRDRPLRLTHISHPNHPISKQVKVHKKRTHRRIPLTAPMALFHLAFASKLSLSPVLRSCSVLGSCIVSHCVNHFSPPPPTKKKKEEREIHNRLPGYCTPPRPSASPQDPDSTTA